MKISELSKRSAITIATIKFYIREGILATGEHTAPNQAAYNDSHLERLRLIKALREQGGLALSVIKEALEAAEQGEERFLVHGIEARANDGLGSGSGEIDDELAPAFELLEALTDRLGWVIDPADPELIRVAKAYTAMDRVWPEGLSRPSLGAYAGAADHLAKVELPDSRDPFAAPDQSLGHAVLGTFLMEPVILALRRAAHRQRGRRLLDQRQAEKQAEKQAAGGKDSAA